MRDILFFLTHFEEIHTIIRWTRDKAAAKERLITELGMREASADGVVRIGVDTFTYEDLELVRKNLENIRRLLRRLHIAGT